MYHFALWSCMDPTLVDIHQQPQKTMVSICSFFFSYHEETAMQHQLCHLTLVHVKPCFANVHHFVLWSCMEMDPTFNGYLSTTPEDHGFYICSFLYSYHEGNCNATSAMWHIPAHVKPFWLSCTTLYYDQVCMEMDPTCNGYQSATPEGHDFNVPWKNFQHQLCDLT